MLVGLLIENFIFVETQNSIFVETQNSIFVETQNFASLQVRLIGKLFFQNVYENY